ncbi:MAG TPA: efflux RND transporter periplasmic adaptor subunit [Tepidisphaeraceae bacterium]|nr:efflux RND transporter periplasmic adaptor subunit [Tepidisphaeraceae bacterium]
MESDLQKLRIDSAHRARHDPRPLWPWIALILLIVGAGIGIWQWRTASAAPTVQTMRVKVPDGPAGESDLLMLNATGYVMAAHKIELASKVVGRVAWVGVEMGDKIEKGQELVRLEDDEFKARVAQQQGLLDNAKAYLAELQAGSRPQEIAAAQARLDQAQAELTNADMNLQRLKALESSKDISPQQIDDAATLARSRRAQLETLRQQYELVKAGPRKEQIDAQLATVRQLEGGLAMAVIDLNNTIIRSQISATVLARNVEVGEFVTTGFVGERGAKGYVVSIADLNDLRVELDISQNDFAKVSSKQPCWIVTDAYPDKKYSGVVDLISPEANRQKATVQVRVKVLNPDELLKPDMNATVSFLAPRKISTTQSATAPAAAERPGIRVPASAVRDGAVFVVENGKAIKRAVAIVKDAGGREVQVRTGLIGGEDLIVSPPESLEDGAKVKTAS